jgi:hypothetical protein
MLEGLPLETLSSWVLEFEGKVRANPIGGPFRSDGSFLGKLLVLPANVRLDWKVIARYKCSSLFGLVVNNKENKFYDFDPRRNWCTGSGGSTGGPTPSRRSSSRTREWPTAPFHCWFVPAALDIIL